jgi:hypothetical protein
MGRVPRRVRGRTQLGIGLRRTRLLVDRSRAILRRLLIDLSRAAPSAVRRRRRGTDLRRRGRMGRRSIVLLVPAGVLGPR